MPDFRSRFVWLSVCAVVLFTAPQAARGQDSVQFFERAVLPLFKEHCYECHSHDSESAEGGLVLDSRRGWAAGGDSGPAVIPGKPEASLLVKAISYTDDDLRMPPDGKLAEAEVAVLRQWIREGAADPRQTQEPRPVLEKSDSSKSLWSLQRLPEPGTQLRSIDQFIDQGLAAAEVSAGPAADRATLLRRASLDLTGLPPTPEQVLQFLADESDEAWEHLIDQLLESPRYGERWGRHWLDLARYADSNGGDINYAYANAWHYRDYVIQAFNDDKPYNEFIREQLAGDLILEGETEDRRRELLTATGFLMLSPKMLAEVDNEKTLIDIVDEQLDVSGKTFLAMTIGCARCHDHKFDPITTEDYYALAGIFRSTKVMQLLRPTKSVGEWIEVDVSPPEIREQIAELSARRDDLEQEISALGVLPGEKKRAGNAAPQAVVADSLPVIESTTWSARVRIHSRQKLGCVLSATFRNASQGHSLGFDNGYSPRVVWNHGGSGKHRILVSSEQVEPGEWHHLAVTYVAPEKHLALFLDGRRVASAGNVDSTPFHAIGVGRREASREWQLHGEVDDVAIFDRALTDEEVARLSTDQILDRQPVLRWDFESLKPGLVVDSEGAHHGTLLGLTAVGHVVPDGFRGRAISFGKPRHLSEADQLRLKQLESELRELNLKIPQRSSVMAVKTDVPVDLPVHIRGSHLNLMKNPVRRSTPRVFDSQLAPVRVAEQSNGRLELANWVADPRNPLTARVMVNRIWQYHFGSGLVRTSSNFGFRGEEPSHPALLDWLASQFIESEWSVKHMHRLIMRSEVYRRSSSWSAARPASPPQDRWLARFPTRRLEAEAIRDSLLYVSGELELGSPGSLLPTKNMTRVKMTPQDSAYQRKCRSVYLPVVRVRGYEMFSIFDVADNGQHVANRPQTMVAQQALFLLNNPFVLERARQIAERVLDRDDSDVDKIDWLHLLMLGRPASAPEAELLIAFLSRLRETESEVDAWQHLVHTLICSNEFIYLR